METGKKVLILEQKYVPVVEEVFQSFIKAALIYLLY